MIKRTILKYTMKNLCEDQDLASTDRAFEMNLRCFSSISFFLKKQIYWANMQEWHSVFKTKILQDRNWVYLFNNLFWVEGSSFE